MNFAGSHLRLPNTSEYSGATINIYVLPTSSYNLGIDANYLLNKTSYSVSPGQMIELTCVGGDGTFTGWYLKE